MRRVHFIGIGGSGLSAIALVLIEKGYQVSGSDRQVSEIGMRLQEKGARIAWSHHPDNVRGVDLVVRSSAVPDQNVEVQAAISAKIPVLKRAEFLEYLIAEKQTIAVAGTHGKTTTTAMIAWMLTFLGLDPSYIIGGLSRNLSTNAHSGIGDHFVIEADEYDLMFLGLRPSIAVITNVEHDHPDFFPTYEDFFSSFQTFITRIQPDGVLIACGEDPGASRLLDIVNSANRSGYSYGIGSLEFDYCADDVSSNRLGCYSFTITSRNGEQIAAVDLQVPGEHNIRNALSVIAVADLLDLSMDKVALALNQFQGTGRRFEIHQPVAEVTIVDDYAHHPTEIKATLSAARSRFPGQRVWAVWQPHTFSRTRTLSDAFLKAFERADLVLISEVYPARERPPMDGYSAKSLVDALKTEESEKMVHFAHDLEEAREYLLENLLPGDVVLVLSAGDADRLSLQLIEDLRMREGSK